MGSNEIANRCEAAAWIAAAGAEDPEGPAPLVSADDFFIRSLNGFIDRIDVLDPQVGTDWDAVGQVTLGLHLDRNYSRRDTSIVIDPVDSFRENAAGDVLGVSYFGPLRVVPLSEQGYAELLAGGTFTLPDSLDPFSRIVVIADLTTYQAGGFGLEFSIQLMRMQQNEDNDTDVQFPLAP